MVLDHESAGRAAILRRIEGALAAACEALPRVPTPTVERKSDGGPVTAADRVLDEVLRANLLQPGEGWLSEESADDPSRLERRQVWIVDPLDGTHEFVAGIPEWAIAVAYVEDGRAVAGGICNPARNETFVGALGLGVTRNGEPARARQTTALNGPILASRSESGRGEWKAFVQAGLPVEPVGSVAYKLALVAAGLADATWTLVPKHEWDVAAGIALVEAAGGFACGIDGEPVALNQRDCRLPGLVAGATGLRDQILALLRRHRAGATSAAAR